MESKIVTSSLLTLVAITFLHCQPKKPSTTISIPSSATLSFDSSAFVEDMNVDFAQNFSIQSHQNYKVAHVHFMSDQRGIQFNQDIVFYPRGQARPETTDTLRDAWFVEVPLQSVAANDDGEITRLTALGLTDNIIAMGGGGIYDPNLRKKWEEKKIESIGYSFHRMPSPELILGINPDLLMLYSYDHGRLEAMQKLRELGINAIPQFAWAEPSILGKAEWIKFTSLFFNKEKEANELFDQIVQRCKELKELVQEKASPQKAFMSYFPSSESDWSVHRNDFYTSFLSFSGAENVLQDDGPNHTVGMNNETFLDLASDADVWIVNSTSDEEWPPANYLNTFKAYRNGDVYHYQKRTRHEHDAYDWYETPEVRPDLVIEDLVSIFYPDVLPQHELLFFDHVKLTKHEK